MGSGTGAGYAKVLGPLDATIAAKLAKYHTGESPGRGKRERDAREQVNSDREKFAVNKEHLYDRQGKLNTIVTNFLTESHMECGPAEGQEGLQAPNIRETGDAVTGDLRRIMRRDSKQRVKNSSYNNATRRNGSPMDPRWTPQGALPQPNSQHIET